MTQLIERLRALPRSERLRALQAAVEVEFRQTLLMTDDEELPLDQSFVELGLSSLGLIETKERLEAQLGQSMSAAMLFNHPTVEALLDHLTTDVLGELFGVSLHRPGGRTPAKAAPAATEPADLVDDLMDDLLGQLYSGRSAAVPQETEAGA
jgi:acyl carrier protein